MRLFRRREPRGDVAELVQRLLDEKCVFPTAIRLNDLKLVSWQISVSGDGYSRVSVGLEFDRPDRDRVSCTCDEGLCQFHDVQTGGPPR